MTMNDKTLEKYRLLIDEWFVNGFNGAQAYLKYYPDAKRPDDSFSKIQRIPEVEMYIQKVQAEISERNKITVDELVQILTKLVRFDVAKLYDENGELKNIHQMDPDARLSLEGVEVDSFTVKGEPFTVTKKVKLSNRKQAIDMLMKHLGGYREDNKQVNQQVIVLSVDPLAADPIDET